MRATFIEGLPRCIQDCVAFALASILDTPRGLRAALSLGFCGSLAHVDRPALRRSPNSLLCQAKSILGVFEVRSKLDQEDLRDTRADPHQTRISQLHREPVYLGLVVLDKVRAVLQ